MQRRQWLTLFGFSLVIAPVAFAFGRWSGLATHSTTIAQAYPKSGAASPEGAHRVVDKTDFSRVAIENLGQVEFDQAYELIHSAPKEALVAWAHRLEEVPVTPRKTSAIAVFFKTLAQIDAKAAADVALAMDRADPRWAAIGAISVATPAADLPEVARMYTTVHEDRIPVAGDFVSRWSASDPEATARFLSSYSGRVNSDDIASFIGNWAAVNPAAATEWLAQASPERRDFTVYAGFYAGWMLNDRNAAVTDLAQRSGDKAFEKALKVVSENLFTESPDAARAFILMLPDDGAQKVAVEQVTAHITSIWLGSGDYLHLKSEDVAKWLFTLPENLWHEQIGSVMENWTREDNAAADAWLNGMPLQTRDQLLAEHCLAFNWNLPTAGLQAGLRISDPELRRNTLRQVFKEIAPDMIEDLLQKATLPVEEAREIRRVVKSL